MPNKKANIISKRVKNNRRYENPSYGPLLNADRRATIRWSHFVNYTAAGLSVQTYRLNSLYDPDETGAGTQPVGFDEIMQLYYYYRVERARVRITCTNAGSAGIIAVTPANQSTDPTQITAMAANFKSKSELIAGTYGQNKTTIVMDLNIRDYFGLKMNVGDDLIGTSSTSPARILYLHVGLEEIDLSAKDMSLFVEIEFDTKFLNSKQLDNS